METTTEKTTAGQDAEIVGSLALSDTYIAAPESTALGTSRQGKGETVRAGRAESQ